MICDVFVAEAGERGLGVFARRAFERGEFIFRRRHGAVVRNADIGTLPEDDKRHLCEIDFERSAVLLAPGCYLNHSCEPNAMRSGVKVFAWTAISADEEITIDYRLNAFDDTMWDCLCGAASCSGRLISSFFALPPERQSEYLRYAPDFIRAEYARRHSWPLPTRRRWTTDGSDLTKGGATRGKEKPSELDVGSVRPDRQHPYL